MLLERDLPDEPTQQLAAYYSNSANAYARLWSPVIRPMGERLLRALPLAGAARVLDVGTGAGALISALRAAAPSAGVVGVDRSEGMLRLARAASPVPLAVMDAQQLALRPASVDVALLVFVLFHLPDPLRGIAEVAEALRPGGTVGSATWGEDKDPPLSEIWTEEVDTHGALPDSLPAVVQQHAMLNTTAKVRALLEAGGFAGIRIWSERFELRWEREDLVALRLAFGVFKRRLESLAPDVRARCLSRIRERMTRAPSEALLHRPEVIFATASRPSGW